MKPMNPQQHFLKLLKYSNELKKKNKSLKNEDPEVFDVFLDFLVRIERNLHYLEKQEYINLAKDFLDDQITADDFSYSFMILIVLTTLLTGYIKCGVDRDRPSFEYEPMVSVVLSPGKIFTKEVLY